MASSKRKCFNCERKGSCTRLLQAKASENAEAKLVKAKAKCGDNAPSDNAPFRPHVSEQQQYDQFSCRTAYQRVFLEMVSLQNGTIRSFSRFSEQQQIDIVFLQNGMIREFFTVFQNSSMIDMVFLQSGMIREFLNNHNMDMIVLMIWHECRTVEHHEHHNMRMIVFLNSNRVVN